MDAQENPSKHAGNPARLILNELVSNCLKHAFPEGRAGTVRVLCAIRGKASVLLTCWTRNRANTILRDVPAGFEGGTAR